MQKLKAVFLFLFSLMGICISHAELPYPYNSIEVLPFDAQSLYSNARAMEFLVAQTHAKVVVELGSWLGASTRHIASILPPDGKVYAIDHWLGSTDQHPLPNLNIKLPTLYQQFLSNVIHAGLTDKIIPVKMTTLEAAQLLDVVPDIVYVDASHGEFEVYQDLVAWFPFVKGHGILCGDDWAWGHDLPIQKAVVRFAREYQLSVHTNGWFWWLQELRG